MQINKGIELLQGPAIAHYSESTVNKPEPIRSIQKEAHSKMPPHIEDAEFTEVPDREKLTTIDIYV